MAHFAGDCTARKSTDVATLLPISEPSISRDLDQPAFTLPHTPVSPGIPVQHSAEATVSGDNALFGAVNDDAGSRQRGGTTVPNTADHIPAQHQDSPARTANVRIRRSNYGSKTLSHSPARAGYATRMRQLFEEAGRHGHDSPKLYPQLPNISRKTSISPSKRPLSHLSTALPSYRPESLCLATSLPMAEPSVSDVQASLLCPSERSSGSWSDDSGYIVTTSRGRRCSFSVPPKERIYKWLSGVSEGELDLDSDQNQMVSTTAHHPQRPTSGSHVLLENLVNSDDPFVSRSDGSRPHLPSQLQWEQNQTCRTLTPGHVSDVCKKPDLDPQDDLYASPPSPATYTPLPVKQSLSKDKPAHNEDVDLEEGGIQLSPLSPNVCLERGPSRHHCSHNLRNSTIMNTPGKDRAYKPFQPGSLKENVVLRQDAVERTTSPLTARKGVLDTRSRRLQ